MTAPQQNGVTPAEPVLVSEQHGAVRILRLNRPESRNALNSELIGALELTLTGGPVSADRALALGLVNVVVPPAEVMDAALHMAERIARNGPLALRATKELVRTASTDLARAQELQATWQPRVFGSADAREGATAFIERRDPVWTGR